ncbi:MAG: hypothetical protein ACLGSD_01600 [Acidobacteriota bacterium]
MGLMVCTGNLGQPRERFRRFILTVCIAAIAEGEEQICVATDAKAAFGDFSSDKGAVKHEHLGNGHITLIAGNDVVYALTVLAKAKKRIENDGIRDSDATAEILYEELWSARNQLIESKVLRKYGMTVQQFTEKGKKSFTDNVFYEICARIDRTELSLTFLLAGFDAKRVPHLRVVTAGEPPQNFDSIAFAAIGSGASAALASLSFAADHHGFGRHSDLHASTYHLLAAKYMAESATDVGHDTFFLSIGKRGSRMVHFTADDAIRASWLKHGAPRDAKPTLQIIKDVLVETDKLFDREVLEKCLKYASGSNKRFCRILVDAMRRKAAMGAPSAPSAPRVLEGQK